MRLEEASSISRRPSGGQSAFFYAIHPVEADMVGPLQSRELRQSWPLSLEIMKFFGIRFSESLNGSPAWNSYRICETQRLQP